MIWTSTIIYIFKIQKFKILRISLKCQFLRTAHILWYLHNLKVHSCIMGDTQDCPHIWWFSKAHGTQNIVVLMFKIYYSKRIHYRIKKGEKAQAESWKLHAQFFLCSLPSLCMLFSPAIKKKFSNMYNVFTMGNPLETQHSKVFIEGWSWGHPVP